MTKPLKAGAGKAAINYTDSFFPVEGFAGIHDRIHARALLLEQEERCLIISLELPSIRPNSLVDELKVRIAQQTGVKTEQIWVCMTHDLCAPHVPDRNAQPECYQIHLSTVERAAMEAAEQAQRNMRIVSASIVSGQSDVNINRDIETAQGWWQGMNPLGESDKMLHILCFWDENEKLTACLCHYAMKSSVLGNAVMEDGMRYVTGDVAGEACRYAERMLHAPVLFLMGAGADQEPKKRADYYELGTDGIPVHVNQGRIGFSYMEQLGRILGEDICFLTENIDIHAGLNPILRLEQREIFLPGQKFWSLGKPYFPVKEYSFVPAQPECLKIKLLLLDQLALFGLQTEPTAVIGKKLREQNPDMIPLLAAMVDGGKDYLSDETAYERLTFGALHSVFAKGAAEAFLEYAHTWLESIKEDKSKQK